MSVLPAGPFLIDFDAAVVASEVIEEAAHPYSPPSEALWTDRIDEAFARGMEEGRQAAEAEAAARLEQQQAAMEQSLAEARAAWCGEQGPQIAGQITAAIHDMESRIAASADRVLRPFLAQAVRERAVSELHALLRALLETNPDMTLAISGPEDLLAAVREGLAGSIAAVSYLVNDATDVQVKAGASIIETRIAAWLQDSTGQSA